MKQILPKLVLLLLTLFVKAAVFAQSPAWDWVKTFNGGNDYTVVSTTDPNGSVYFAGTFSSSTLTIGGTTVTNNSAGTPDIVLIKYDANGNVLWVKSAGGNNVEYFTSITTDASGNLIGTGPFLSTTIDFGGVTLSKTGGNDDFFLVKYDTSGNVLWAKGASSNGNEAGRAVTTDPSGNIYVAGQFFDATISFGSITLSNNGNADMFVVKYDAAGNPLWAKSGGGGSEDEPYGIALDANGNIFLIGHILSSTATFQGITLTRAGSYADMFLLKYNNSGDILWARNSLGNHYLCDGVAVTTDASGNVIATGSFDGSVAFGNITLTSLGGNDLYLVKYDPSGNLVWGRREGGSGNDLVLDNCHILSVDPCSHIYVGGIFDSSPITLGNTSFSGFGSYDNFILKYDPSGNLEWAKQTGSPDYDFVTSVNYNVNGVYVSGLTHGAPAMFDSIETSGRHFLAKLLNGKVEAGNDAIVYFGSPSVQSLNCKTLTATVTNSGSGGTFNWISIPSSTIANNTGSQITVCPQINTKYIVTYTISSNCAVTDTVLVKAIEVACGNNNNKVKVCITTPSGQQTTICVAQSAVASVLTNNPNAMLGDCSAYNSRPNSIVQNEGRSNDIKIYPNPTSGNVYINTKPNNSATIRIFDVQGKLIQKKQITSSDNSIKLDLSSLNKGLYIVEVVQNGNKLISKLVIQ